MCVCVFLCDGVSEEETEPQARVGQGWSDGYKCQLFHRLALALQIGQTRTWPSAFRQLSWEETGQKTSVYQIFLSLIRIS